jgi:putative transposase
MGRARGHRPYSRDGREQVRGHRPHMTNETMKYDPNKHHRRSIRLKGYDYSQPGAYFVTICINGGLPTLGKICNSQMYASKPGQMVQNAWDELPLHYPGVAVDAFVLMPDHIHGIIFLTADNTMILGDVVHRFKSLTTAKYRHGVMELGWTPFPKRFWQRNYHESIIRDEASLDKIRRYILNNPIAGESDQLHLQQYHPQPDL